MVVSVHLLNKTNTIPASSHLHPLTTMARVTRSAAAAGASQSNSSADTDVLSVARATLQAQQELAVQIAGIRQELSEGFQKFEIFMEAIWQVVSAVQHDVKMTKKVLATTIMDLSTAN